MFNSPCEQSSLRKQQDISNQLFFRNSIAPGALLGWVILPLYCASTQVAKYNNRLIQSFTYKPKTMEERYIKLEASFLQQLAAAPAEGEAPALNAGARGAATTRNKPAKLATAIDAKQLGKLKPEETANLAPSIPTQLIKPMQVKKVRVENRKPATKAIALPTWGIKAVGADTSPFTGKGITVAVLDTGINKDHPAFAHLRTKIKEKDFTGEGNGDTHGHGTHCAGTICGGVVNDTRIGIAPGIKKLLIGKVLGDSGGGTTEMIIDAIQWAISEGANIISMSLGMDFPGYSEALRSRGLPAKVAVSKALEGYRSNVLLFEKLATMVRTSSDNSFSQPVIMVAAAGNESRKNQQANFEIAVAPPAVADGMLSVAAVGMEGTTYRVAPFSNIFAKIAAPGVDVISADAHGDLIAMSGTSMATPHVAGVAALWAEKLVRDRGVLSVLDLTSQLIATATNKKMAAGTKPKDIGSGMVQAPQA